MKQYGTVLLLASLLTVFVPQHCLPQESPEESESAIQLAQELIDFTQKLRTVGQDILAVMGSSSDPEALLLYVALGGITVAADQAESTSGFVMLVPWFKEYRLTDYHVFLKKRFLESTKRTNGALSNLEDIQPKLRNPIATQPVDKAIGLIHDYQKLLKTADTTLQKP